MSNSTFSGGTVLAAMVAGIGFTAYVMKPVPPMAAPVPVVKVAPTIDYEKEAKAYQAQLKVVLADAAKTAAKLEADRVEAAKPKPVTVRYVAVPGTYAAVPVSRCVCSQ